MDINEFIEKFTEQLDETDPAEIKADTVFKELEEWSSMTVLSIIAMIDDEYNVQLKGNDIRAVETIQELFDKVVSLKK